jgi:signal transduction histidine kinase
MQRDPLERLSIRAALGIGFGLVLGLWVFTGYALTGRMAEIEVQTSAVTARYLRAQDVLSATRSQVNVSSILLRDALLDPDPEARPRYQQRLEDNYRTIDDALNSYVPIVEPDGSAARIDQLRAEIAAFRLVMFEVLDAHYANDSLSPSDLLASRISPRRAAAIAISDEIRAFNREALIQHQVATAAIHRTAERQWWLGLGGALAATVAIALLAIVYAGRLEDRLRGERDKDAQHAHDLQLLSARLVAAQEEERRTISRELHDEVGQLLTAIKVELQLARASIQAHGDATTSLDDLQSLTDGALRTVRDLSQLLRPAMLDDLGLSAAIDWLLRGLARRHRVRGELVQEGMSQRLDTDTEVAVFRIVQEALTNVARHAAATTCHVRLVRRGAVLSVSVEDDGIGFERSLADQADSRRGLGLIGIRERVLLREGTLTIDGGPGRGTRIDVTFPVAAPASAIATEESEGVGSLSVAAAKVSHG